MLPLSVVSIAELLGLSSYSKKIVTGASFDSRSVMPQELFFALKGEKVDGHNFIRDVAERGAACAVVSKEYRGDNYGLELLRVDDPLEALHVLARWFLHVHKPKVVGITGSIGKTTTKDFTATLLRSKYRVGATPGNANSRIGAPISILNMKGNEEILVIEMGMSEKGDLSKLVQIIPPDIALITTVSYSHACFFDSLEEIALAKAEILSHSKTQVAILNRSMPYFEVIKKMGNSEKIFYSMNQGESAYSIRRIKDKAEVFYQKQCVLSIPWTILGEHNLLNFLASVCIARTCGVSFDEISAASKNLKLPPKRLERVEKDGIVIINDAYNANQNSMCAALSSLPEPQKGGKKIAVLGDIRELGKFSESAHLEVAEHALKHVDLLLCVGEGCKVMHQHWKTANRDAYHLSNNTELLKKLKEVVAAGDVVLLKGSRSHGLDLFVEQL